MNPNIDLHAFIKQNHGFMTIGDLVEETGAHYGLVKRALAELNLAPISKSEQTKQTILANYHRLSLAEFCKRYGMCKAKIKLYCAELKVSFLPEEEQSAIVPASVLNRVRDPMKPMVISQQLNTVKGGFSRNEARRLLLWLFDKHNGII